MWFEAIPRLEISLVLAAGTKLIARIDQIPDDDSIKLMSVRVALSRRALADGRSTRNPQGTYPRRTATRGARSIP